MGTPQRLDVSELDEKECEALLDRQRIGRIAFSFHDRVDIQPILLVFRDGWLFGRTSEGSKLTTIRHNRWVAFQVDEIQDLWHWESVVVRGAVHLLDDDGGSEREELRAKAEQALRDVVPETFAGSDPAPHRSILFGLAPQEIAGRRARLAPASGGSDS